MMRGWNFIYFNSGIRPFSWNESLLRNNAAGATTGLEVFFKGQAGQAIEGFDVLRGINVSTLLSRLVSQLPVINIVAYRLKLRLDLFLVLNLYFKS
jgi:hypothetical protein